MGSILRESDTFSVEKERDRTEKKIEVQKKENTIKCALLLVLFPFQVLAWTILRFPAKALELRTLTSN